jgi:hypothetical protein
MKKLKSLEKSDLVELVNRLTSLNKENSLLVKTFLSDSTEIDTDEFKKQISKVLSFNPERGKWWDFKKTFNILKSLELSTTYSLVLADVFVHAAEEGENITDELGDIDEKYYDNMVKLFEKAAQYTSKAKKEGHDIQYLYKTLEEVYQSSQNIGWGYCDDIAFLWKIYLDTENGD